MPFAFEALLIHPGTFAFQALLIFFGNGSHYGGWVGERGQNVRWSFPNKMSNHLTGPIVKIVSKAGEATGSQIVVKLDAIVVISGWINKVCMYWVSQKSMV